MQQCQEGRSIQFLVVQLFEAHGWGLMLNFVELMLARIFLIQLFPLRIRSVFVEFSFGPSVDFDSEDAPLDFLNAAFSALHPLGVGGGEGDQDA